MKTLLRRHSERRRLRALLRAGEGQGQIEFILSILTIMFTIFWTWEVVLAVYTYNVLSDAAKEGVRYAIVHGDNNAYCSGTPPGGKSCPTPPAGTPPNLCDGSPMANPDAAADNVKRIVKCYAALSLHDISSLSNPGAITVTYTNSNDAAQEVDVTVKYTYVPFLALPITPALQAASSGRIAN